MVFRARPTLLPTSQHLPNLPYVTDPDVLQKLNICQDIPVSPVRTTTASIIRRTIATAWFFGAMRFHGKAVTNEMFSGGVRSASR